MVEKRCMASVTSCIVEPNGTTVTITWDEAVTMANTAGLVLLPDGEGSNPTCAYSSGSGTATTVHTVVRSNEPDIVYDDETFTLAYAAAFGDIAELDSGTPVGNFLDVPVTNNSTQPRDTTPPTVTDVTVQSSGRRILITFSEKIGAGADLDGGWSFSGLQLLNDSRNGRLTIEAASWADGEARTQLLVRLNMTVYASESPSNLFLSYSGGDFADESGNALASFSARPFDANNSEVVVRQNQTSSSAKKFYLWMGQDAYEPKEFYELRRDNPNTSIYRPAVWTENQWFPSDTTDPQAVPYITAEEVEVPANFLLDFLSDESHWEKGSTPHINLGLLRAIVRGDTAQENDFKVAKPLYLYDGIWWDPEPGSGWLSYADERFSQAEKDAFFAAMVEIDSVVKSELGSSIPSLWYSYNPNLTGRVTSGIAYGGASSIVGHARKNIAPDVVDDTPIFGERNFYASGDTWQEIFDADDFSNDRAYDQFGRFTDGHLLVSYPSAHMMEPDDPDLISTSAENNSGGLQFWKDWVQSMIDHVPPGREIVVLLRSVFNVYNVLQDTGDFAASEEAPFDEAYWKGMIQWLLDNPRVTGIGYFAGGITMTTDLGNGTTPQQLTEWALELIEPYNAAAAAGDGGTTSPDTGGSNGSGDNSGDDTDDGTNDGDSAPGEVETPVITGRVVEGRAYMTLSGASATQDLRYTTDGSNPTEESDLYEGQIELPEVTSEGLEIRTRYFSKTDPSKRSLVTVIRIRSGDESVSEDNQ